MAENPSDKVDVKKLLGTVAPIITSAVTGAIVKIALSVIKEAVASNRKRSTVVGDEEMHPTKQETDLAENEASGAKTDSSMAADEVSIQDGGLSTVETEAKAATGEATASENGATASRVKAGASDVETKALKMM